MLLNLDLHFVLHYRSYCWRTVVLRWQGFSLTVVTEVDERQRNDVVQTWDGFLNTGKVEDVFLLDGRTQCFQ